MPEYVIVHVPREAIRRKEAYDDLSEALMVARQMRQESPGEEFRVVQVDRTRPDFDPVQVRDMGDAYEPEPGELSPAAAGQGSETSAD